MGEAGVPIVRLLLEYNADATKESIQAWSALHFAYSDNGCATTVGLLTAHLQKTNPEFLKTFDPKKEKDTTRRPHNRRKHAK